MRSTETAESQVDDVRLEEILAEYLAAEAAGNRPDRQLLVADHPELAGDLNEFFRRQDWMRRLVGHSGSAGDSTSRAGPETENFAGQTPINVKNSGSASRLGTFGDYELLEEIARGGMGVIYRARHASLNRIVALKMILANKLASDEEIERFYVEAEAAAQLDHPGIVPIYEVGSVNAQHYYSMAFVEGRSLQAVIAEAGVVDPRQAAELVRRVAEAMAYAHGRGIVHRDLKPANILLAQSNRSDALALALGEGELRCEPKVTDFGLAKQTEGDAELTGTGQILGTPSFMPPEQARGDADQIGPRSDVYSLGAVLYCLLTGRPPFRAANVLETLQQVMQEEPVPPRRVNSAVPRDLESICLKCLEKHPAKRFESAQSLAEDLQSYLNGHPIKARPVTSIEKALKWVRRRPATAGFASATIVAILTSAALLVVLPLYRQIQTEKTAVEKARAEAVKQRDRAETSEYHLGIFRADLYLRNGEAGAAREMLSSLSITLRDWEWNYLFPHVRSDRSGEPAMRPLDSQPGAVVGLGFSDSKEDILVSGCSDGAILAQGASAGGETRVLGRFAGAWSLLAR